MAAYLPIRITDRASRTGAHTCSASMPAYALSNTSTARVPSGQRRLLIIGDDGFEVRRAPHEARLGLLERPRAWHVN